MKSSAMEDWEALIVRYEPEMDLETYYFGLLDAADELLRNGFVSDTEWRQMARLSADFFIEMIERGQGEDIE